MSTWDESHAKMWKDLGSPFRPSERECKIYRKELSKFGRDARVLLLGSTPEIRDIASELHLALTVVDFSKDNYPELGKLMKRKPYRETFVNENWLDIKFTSEFDVVIGDCELSVLLPRDVPKVVRNISNALKPGATYITRAVVYNPREHYEKKEKIDELMGKFENRRELFEMLYVPFCVYYKPEIGAIIECEVYRRIRGDVEKGLLPEICVEAFEPMRFYTSETYVVPRDEFENAMSPYFEVTKTFDGLEPFSKDWLIYVLQKR